MTWNNLVASRYVVECPNDIVLNLHGFTRFFALLFIIIINHHHLLHHHLHHHFNCFASVKRCMCVCFPSTTHRFHLWVCKDSGCWRAGRSFVRPWNLSQGKAKKGRMTLEKFRITDCMYGTVHSSMIGKEISKKYKYLRYVFPSYTLNTKTDRRLAIDWSVGGVHWPLKTTANIVDKMYH